MMTMTAMARARARTLLALAATVATGLTLGSCNVNEYCLNCASLDGGGGGDGGDGDGGERPDGNGVAFDGCLPNATELCDGMDNDCDGMTDEGTLPMVGEACGVAQAPCSVGVYECTAGELRCTGVEPSAETCDNVDNDCDGTVDDGDPGGGAFCGNDLGECIAGVTRCVGGALDCVGEVPDGGGPVGAETCNGRDDDCDGMFDEAITLGSCAGTTDVGECSAGALMCLGGVAQCVGDVGPTFELCDALDQDCDGNPTNGYNLTTDPRNCGACGNVCNLPNAVEGCNATGCIVAACDPGFWDRNPGLPGCEYACDFQSSTEACNQQDDDCDTRVDENMTVPNICDTDGACAGTTAVCEVGGWDCNYGANVSQDAMGNIVPETACDGIDNDCDGAVDESHPTKGQACGDTGLGVCRGTGSNICNTADPDGPVVCNITSPGQAASGEICDNLDNNCNGTVDDGVATGALIDWVDTGDFDIMKYEASRPDATATSAGAASSHACARTGRQPWTNITHPQAEAVCASVGARLCTEQEWHQACSVVPASTFPVAGPGASPAQIFIEAEDYETKVSAVSGGVTRAWVPDTTPGFSGISALRASPNTGANLGTTTALTEGPRLTYRVNFAAAGNHYVWVRMFSPTGNDDRLFVGVGSFALQNPVTPTNGGWVWVRTGAFNIAAAGTQTVTIYMDEDGLKFDALAITRENNTSNPPTTINSDGGTWSFQSNPDTYQANVCNDDGLDTDTVTTGDQDGNLASGALTSCFANGAGAADVYDLSGNVKEWTAERQPGVNPIRGGAANNEGTGTTCGLSFTSADDAFFFPNVGFRCCR